MNNILALVKLVKKKIRTNCVSLHKYCTGLSVLLGDVI